MELVIIYLLALLIAAMFGLLYTTKTELNKLYFNIEKIRRLSYHGDTLTNQQIINLCETIIGEREQ